MEETVEEPVKRVVREMAIDKAVEVMANEDGMLCCLICWPLDTMGSSSWRATTPHFPGR
jgi:hypothetical protein